MSGVVLCQWRTINLKVISLLALLMFQNNCTICKIQNIKPLFFYLYYFFYMTFIIVYDYLAIFLYKFFTSLKSPCTNENHLILLDRFTLFSFQHSSFAFIHRDTLSIWARSCGARRRQCLKGAYTR